MPYQLSVDGVTTNSRVAWKEGATDFLKERFRDDANDDNAQEARQLKLEEAAAGSRETEWFHKEGEAFDEGLQQAMAQGDLPIRLDIMAVRGASANNKSADSDQCTS